MPRTASIFAAIGLALANIAPDARLREVRKNGATQFGCDVFQASFREDDALRTMVQPVPLNNFKGDKAARVEQALKRAALWRK